MERFAVRLESVKDEGDGWGSMEHVWAYGVRPLRELLHRLCANDCEGMELDKVRFDIMLNEALIKAEDLDETCKRLLRIKEAGQGAGE